ncbi:uncharacterized protein [Excalfactoria chinensis]|uniref:uncharacterized protein n=1 Tax=Excalfactoria chinensis TaxID=46218 RepID=UPI003B3B48FA
MHNEAKRSVLRGRQCIPPPAARGDDECAWGFFNLGCSEVTALHPARERLGGTTSVLSCLCRDCLGGQGSLFSLFAAQVLVDCDRGRYICGKSSGGTTGRGGTTIMEFISEVLFSFCKEYCGETAPSLQEIAAILTYLERDGELSSPREILDCRKWDPLTVLLAEHAATAQAAAELVTWGVILGALKAAREEGKLVESCLLVGLVFEPEQPGGRPGKAAEDGGTQESRLGRRRGDGTGSGRSGEEKVKDGEFQSTTPPLDRQVDTSAPYPLSLGGGECGRAVNSSGRGSRRAPDPGGVQTWCYPGGGNNGRAANSSGWRSRRVPDPGGAQTWCYPGGGSSQVQRDSAGLRLQAWIGQVSAGGPAPSVLACRAARWCRRGKRSCRRGGRGCAGCRLGLARLCPPRGRGQRYGCWRRRGSSLLRSVRGPPDRTRARLLLRCANGTGPTEPAAASCSLAVAPVACQSCRGQGLDSPARSRSTFRHRAAGCCREFRLPLALNTLETLTAHSPVLPHDIESLAYVILKLVQYTFWKEGWMTELGRVVAAEQDDPFHPVHGIDMQEGIKAECLEYKFSPEMMQLVGFDIQPCVKKLWNMQKLVGALQWVRGALGIPARLMKPLYGQLKGSDPKEPQNPSSKMAAAWQKILQSCMEGSLAQWDTARGLEMAQLAQLVEHETLDLRMVVWQDPNRSSQAAVFTNRMVSVQMLEVMAVTVAVHLWQMIPSNTVADSIFAAKLLARRGWEDFPSSEAAGILDETLASHTAPVASLHVHGHSEVPSLFTRGNVIADTVASTPVFGLGSLQIWQTGVIWEPCLSPRQWLAIAVNTSSTVITATEHVRSGLTAVRYHLATAVAMVGLPSHVETDNGSCFTSRFTQEWLVKTDYGKWDKSSFLTGAVGGEAESGT